MLDQVVAAVVGGFLGWVVIQAVSYYVVRWRLITYLVVQANTRLQSAHGNREWLQQLSSDHSVAGVTATVAPRYSPDHAEDLHESRELVLRYLSRSEIERVTKFLSYLWEAEYLTEGVCEAIGAYATRATPLTADDCQYLRDKVARVTSIVSRWPRSTSSLKELPIDYAGMQGPGAVKVPPKPARA
jgi:hypothetical protein